MTLCLASIHRTSVFLQFISTKRGVNRAYRKCCPLPRLGDQTGGGRMAKRKPRIQHAEVVGLFAARLREVRRSRGLTQAELAQRATVTASYVWRLESGGAAPGIDL